MVQRRRRVSKATVSAAWRAFAETPEGRAAIGALMARFGVYSPFLSGDQTAIAIQAGERNVAAWIAEQCSMKPEAYVDHRHEIDHLFEFSNEH